jgi:transcriptional regulator with XRE-family HTH domain
MTQTPEQLALQSVIGRNIAAIRAARRMEVEELAAELGVDSEEVAAWEAGTQPIPVRSLARALEVTLATLLDEHVAEALRGTTADSAEMVLYAIELHQTLAFISDEHSRLPSAENGSQK